MMEELVTVVAVHNNQISVVSQIKSSCSSCSQIDTCGSGQIAKAIPHKELAFTLSYDLAIKKRLKDQTIKAGDCLIIGLPEIDVLHSAWQVYLFPIFGLIGSSALSQWLLLNGFLTHEMYALLLGCFGGYLGYLFAKRQQSNTSDQLLPKILRLIPQDLSVEIRGN
ncbi:MAG: SoxR reducing system RseC family protein [Colwellia sp.]